MQRADCVDYLAAAPLCYEELRLVPVAGYSLTIKTAWRSLQDNEKYAVDHDFDKLPALAAALRRLADVQGQAVRLSDDEAYLSLLLVKTQ